MATLLLCCWHVFVCSLLLACALAVSEAAWWRQKGNDSFNVHGSKGLAPVHRVLQVPDCATSSGPEVPTPAAVTCYGVTDEASLC